jgi:polysaccharide export outer membrane protein
MYTNVTMKLIKSILTHKFFFKRIALATILVAIGLMYQPPRLCAQQINPGASDVILAGDRLSIKVLGDEDLTAVWHGTSVGYTVDAAGHLNFPLLGQVKAAGLSIQELQDHLQRELGLYLVDPLVNISFYDKKINQRVSILGQIVRSGVYDYVQGMTITQLISQAGDFVRVQARMGGLKYLANTAQVQVTRRSDNGELTINVNVQDILDGRAPDFPLEIGDLVMVPEKSSAQSVSILGQVAKPGNYELTPDMSLVRLISDAEGFTRLANASRIVISNESQSKTSRVVDAQTILMGKGNDVQLEAGDVVYVPESVF